ncbi:hypothetical protein AAKU55_003115 [Oxalobacteraceae bacterium GrIS 1.11]
MKWLMPTLAACALALCGPAGAQTVYKCTTDGKLSYADAPCAGGTSVALPAPPVPATPSAGAGAEIARQGALAERLRKERLRREAKDERAQQSAQRAAAKHGQRCAALRQRHQWAVDDAATASDKTRAKAELKARRAGEKLTLACPA